MKALIEVEIDAPDGKRAMIELAEALAGLAADVLRAGVVPPLVVRNAAGDVVGTLAVEAQRPSGARQI
jgi:hypothetical protein